MARAGATLILMHSVEHVEADRPLKIGRVEIYQLVGSFGRNQGEGSFGQA